MSKKPLNNDHPEQIKLNLAIVGGGERCKSFLQQLGRQTIPYLDIRIVGVCDIHSEAVGITLAREMGIYTTQDYRDLLKIKDLSGLIELAGNRNIVGELVRLMPTGLWILDHSVVKVIQNFFSVSQNLKSIKQEMVQEKMVTEFLMQQSHERIVVLNPDFTIVEANEAYLKAVNKPREEVINSHCYEVTHGFSSPCSQWQPEMGCPLIETLRTGESAHVIHEHTIGEGIQTYCDLETYPVGSPGGKISRVVEIWRDVTEELNTRWETRLRELKTDISKLVHEDRLISLGKLSASCVHEINNPIQGLLTFCGLMQSIMNEDNPSLDELRQFREYLSLMHNELERCGQIVSGLLSFSRASKNKTKDIDLKEVLHAVIQLTKHRMELQNIILDLKMSKVPITIRGDVNDLQQCFLNLIFNAIEAMPDGGRLSIELKRIDEQESAHVVVKDTGCGISKKDITQIFDPFFTTKAEGEGTGLGLSIAYGVVKSHEGDLDVTSKMGEGSTFTLSFPLR
ncbi:MAG: ATP-binding protein [Desulfatiglans sp.]|nr:ATP-binding protein [Thermodesulfobacteriota bacterium]MEE4352687.1 ATP-binding protein [Desulfatiglans sp.]